MPTANKPIVVSADLRNQIIADAQDLPDLVARAQTLDPALFSALTQGASMASATPLGAFVAADITWLVTTYGLGWSPTFVDMLSGAAIVAGGYAVHWWQSVRNAPAPIAPAPSTTA